jgi:hypothetical protein
LPARLFQGIERARKAACRCLSSQSIEISIRVCHPQHASFLSVPIRLAAAHNQQKMKIRSTTNVPAFCVTSSKFRRLSLAGNVDYVGLADRDWIIQREDNHRNEIFDSKQWPTNREVGGRNAEGTTGRVGRPSALAINPTRGLRVRQQVLGDHIGWSGKARSCSRTSCTADAPT